MTVTQEAADGKPEPLAREVEPGETTLVQHPKGEAESVPEDVEAVADREVE